MNQQAKEELAKYRHLRNEVNNLCEKLSVLHKDRMECKEGCSQCCMNFQVLPVEYFAILEELRNNLPAEFRELDEDADECNFLIDDMCQIYVSRPFICRTHGLPLLFMNQEGDAWELSACPLNFTDFDNFHSDNTFPQDTYNSKLFLINQQFIKHYKQEGFGEFDLIPITRLVKDISK